MPFAALLRGGGLTSGLGGCECGRGRRARVNSLSCRWLTLCRNGPSLPIAAMTPHNWRAFGTALQSLRTAWMRLWAVWPWAGIPFPMWEVPREGA